MVVVSVACPLLIATAAPPAIVTPLLVKLTVPSLAGPMLDTVAVKVTLLSGEVVKEGLLFEVMDVVVEGGIICVIDEIVA